MHKQKHTQPHTHNWYVKTNAQSCTHTHTHKHTHTHYIYIDIFAYIYTQRSRGNVRCKINGAKNLPFATYGKKF